jgi:hypothetical protein
LYNKNGGFIWAKDSGGWDNNIFIAHNTAGISGGTLSRAYIYVYIPNASAGAFFPRRRLIILFMVKMYIPGF